MYDGFILNGTHGTMLYQMHIMCCDVRQLEITIQTIQATWNRVNALLQFFYPSNSDPPPKIAVWLVAGDEF